MTRPPNTPESEEPENQVFSARIPWRERQGLTSGKMAKKNLGKARKVLQSRKNAQASPSSQPHQSSRRLQVPDRRTSAPAESKKTATQPPETPASGAFRSARRHHFVSTGPGVSAVRNKRSARGQTSENRATEQKSNARLSFGGIALSGKVLLMVLLAGLVALLTVPTLAQMWRQQMTYNAIKERVAATEAANEEMRAELERWKDPTYVASQARARLGYVRPGETEYMVADSGNQTSLVQTEIPTGPAKPWVQVLALTIQAADQTNAEGLLVSDLTLPKTGGTDDQGPASGGQSGSPEQQSGAQGDAADD